MDAGELEALLEDRLVMTRYNGWLYTFDALSETLTIDSLMPGDPKKAAAAAAAAQEAQGNDSASTGAGAPQPESEQEPAPTFREYYA